MSAEDIYNSINSIEDLELHLTDTEDGESHFLELKNFSTNKSGDMHNKLKLAKEMSAFTNTSGGIIVLGVSRSEDGTIVTQDNLSVNLSDWFDGNSMYFTEPFIPGVQSRPIGENGAIVIYVPPGPSVPYRVYGYKKGVDPGDKDIPRQYFQRIGTKSVPIPESIVRYMYNSKSRVPDVSFYPDILSDRQHIKINIFAKPDEVSILGDYYLKVGIKLYDNTGMEIILSNYGLYKMLNIFYIDKEKIYPGYEPVMLDHKTLNDQEGIMNPEDGFDNQKEFNIEDWYGDIAFIEVTIEYAYSGRPLIKNAYIFHVDKGCNNSSSCKKDDCKLRDRTNDFTIAADEKLNYENVRIFANNKTNFSSLSKGSYRNGDIMTDSICRIIRANTTS